MMSTDQPTLTEFLLARIAEDEAVAREPHESVRAERVTDMDRIEWDDACGYARLGVGRVLAECEAKRRIVEGFTVCPWCAQGVRCVTHDVSVGAPTWHLLSGAEERVARFLALPYADHPNFRVEWRP